MQKKGRHAKKGRKYILNFEIHTKKSKMEKKKEIQIIIYLDFFRFYIPYAFFCILNLKIHMKKEKMQKKSKQIFSNSQNTYAKKDAKKAGIIYCVCVYER